MIKTVFLDEYRKAGPNDITRIDKGFIDPQKLLNIKGECGEEILFADSPFGRMTEQKFKSLAYSLKAGWQKNDPVTVFVEADGTARIHEGYHRLRAAEYSGILAYTEIRYFGNGQKRNEI